jgi:hypothetical protein
MSKIYTTSTLSDGTILDIHELNLGLSISAFIKFPNNEFAQMIYIFTKLISINGEFVTIDFIESLGKDDINMIVNAIATQNLKLEGLL